jgi:hypothetical protein
VVFDGEAGPICGLRLTREECRRQETAAQIASRAHQKQVIAQWIAQYGTPQQRARQAAGVLPMEEVIAAMTNQAFEAGNGFEGYPMGGAPRLQQRLRQIPQYTNVVINPTDLTILGTDAVKATEAQWDGCPGTPACIPRCCGNPS